MQTCSISDTEEVGPNLLRGQIRRDKSDVWIQHRDVINVLNESSVREEGGGS